MPKTVMVIDDEPGMTELVKIMLRRANLNVLTSTNPLQAINEIDQTPIDLFILDVMMPGMNGFELCQYIRTKPHQSEARIIILTALADLESRQKGQEVGANVFMNKSQLSKNLITQVQGLLGVQHSHQ
ncbi:MAG: response regulator [Chloroflexi bacterium]|nr:response regulator [Chloroflexota bacterium]